MSLYFRNQHRMSYSRMGPFNEQTLIDFHPSAAEVAYCSPDAFRYNWFNDDVQDWSTKISQTTPDDSFTSYSLLAAPDLPVTYRSESVWSGDRPSYPSVTSAFNWQNSADPPISSLFDQLLSPDTITSLAQLTHTSSVCTGEVLTAAGGSPIPSLVRRHYSVRKPVDGSAGKHTGASRTQSATGSSRHTPYPLGHNSANRGHLTAICQWTTGAAPCNETVVGTKRGIGQHLQARHAIRSKPDMSLCLWEDCRKPMRTESLPRHILAVHMKDKVPCKGCGSRFARLDSLQRHQRTCQATVQGEDTPEDVGV